MDKFVRVLVTVSLILGTFTALAQQTVLAGVENPPTTNASEEALAQKIEASKAKKKLLAQKVAELEQRLLLQVQENERLDKIIANLSD